MPEQPGESLRDNRRVGLAWIKFAAAKQRDAHRLEKLRRGREDGNWLYGIRPVGRADLDRFGIEEWDGARERDGTDSGNTQNAVFDYLETLGFPPEFHDND